MFKFFRKETEHELQLKARANYEKVASLPKDSTEFATLRLRISALCKAHIDKTFIEGAELTRIWQDACAHNLVQGSPKPELPQPKMYQFVKSLNSDTHVWTWIPEDFTKEIFNLGSKYQIMAITAVQAIDQTQKIAEMICKNDIKLNNSFLALEFLREEEIELKN